MALTKVTTTTLFAIASTASNVDTVGSAVDVSTYYGIHVRVRMGRATGSAFTVGPKCRIEGSYVAAGNTPTHDQWVVLAQWQAALGTNVASQAVSGTANAGDATLTLAAGTNFAADDYVFVHNSTIGNSEWIRVESVSGAVLTPEETMVNAQTGSTARDQAEQYVALIDVTGIQQIRFIAANKGTGQAVIYAAEFGAVSGL